MAGVKGRSGRKSNADNSVRLRVIQSAWEVLDAQLQDPETPLAVKLDIALRICPKTIPTELTGDLGVTVNAMGTIEKVVTGGEHATTTHLKFNLGSAGGEDDDAPAA